MKIKVETMKALCFIKSESYVSILMVLWSFFQFHSVKHSSDWFQPTVHNLVNVVAWFTASYESFVLELDYTRHAVCLFLNAVSKHNTILRLVVLAFFTLYRLFILSFRLQTYYSSKTGFSLFCRGTTDSAVVERHHWLVVQETLVMTAKLPSAVGIKRIVQPKKNSLIIYSPVQQSRMSSFFG